MLKWLLLLIICLEPLFVMAASPSMAERWQQFSQSVEHSARTQVISQHELRRYPQELLQMASQYPNLHDFSWQDLQRLYQLHTTCVLFKSTNPQLQQAIAFEKTLCSGKLLPQGWFSHKLLLHPAGGSYADRYANYLSAKFGADSQVVRQFVRSHQTDFTLASADNPLQRKLALLESDGQDAVLNGYLFYLDKAHGLWQSTSKGIFYSPKNHWQGLARQAGIDISLQTPEASCSIRYGNLCIKPMAKSLLWLWVAGLFVLVIICVMGFAMLWERRREAIERKFILQLLTHELRTPITSLGLTVEQFRQCFDQLDAVGESAFYRLLVDYQRLQQLTETSHGFLSQDKHSLLKPQRAYVSDWLKRCLNKYALPYSLNQDACLSLPYYWLSVCLDNLIRNALIHGKEPIEINVSVAATMLKVTVQDQGNSSFLWLNAAKRKLRSQQSAKGMGVGLFLVKRIMKKMGGRLIHHTQPTRYILELPL